MLSCVLLVMTRLPSNLRQTTCKWHSKKPHAISKLLGSVSENQRYWWLKFYISGIGIFDVFGSMIFIYKLDPYWLDIYCTCKNELPMSMLLKVITRQTDRQNYNYYTSHFTCDNNNVGWGHCERSLNSSDECSKEPSASQQAVACYPQFFTDLRHSLLNFNQKANTDKYQIWQHHEQTNLCHH